jgi:FkbM family methyltransferase
MNNIVPLLKKNIKIYLQPYIFRIKQFYLKKKMGPGGPKKEFLLNKNIEWFGTDYGGFFLDRTLVSKNCVYFSFGIGTDISFDRSIAAMGLKKIFLFDPTPKAIEFIKEARLPKYYRFFSYGISSKDEISEFFLPTIDGYISGSMIYHNKLGEGEKIFVELKRLITICRNLKVVPDILKIDIEGSEFEVIKDVFESQIFPLQICIEFHSRFFDDGNSRLENSLQLFSRNGYTLAGKSTEEEFLFVRKFK